MKTFLRVTIELPEERQERLIAELDALGFLGFEQQDGQLAAWIDRDGLPSGWEAGTLGDHLSSLDPQIGRVSHEEIREENWNAIWEASIQPLRIGVFHVRPSWSSPVVPEGLREMVIDPKMSFGTGSHATTRLMLEYLGEHPPLDRAVLDAGTGTGILAIASSLLGARSVLAFDHDPLCMDNAQENLERNAAGHNVELALGGFEVVPESATYDLVLANINTAVHRQSMGTMAGLLRPEARLVITGLLTQDAAELIELAQRNALRLIDRADLQEWCRLEFSLDPRRPSASTLEDQDVIQRILSGDSTGYQVLMTKYRDPLQYHIRKLCRDAAIVEDLAQEAFIKAFDNLHNYNDSYAFSTWLYRIATNHTIDHLRRKKIREISIHEPISAKDGEFERELPDDRFTPDREVVQSQRREILHAAIEALPDKYRDVIRLRHMEELTYQEIAEQLDLPIGTVKAHLYRAREMLFKRLKSAMGSF